ncbi:Nucleolar protein 16 [Malassezia sp. CBS 17886]|nr:Nucleolar protein 16 [Malassezia sp. CBS 17886]
MANPRQRRKAHSGKHSGATKSAKRAAKQRLKRAPTVMGPDVLREHWDPTKTVRQNYAKLGLVPSLSKQTGGLDHGDPYAKRPAAADRAPRKGMARIVRDAEGNVVDVLEADADEGDEETPWGPVLNDENERDEDPPMLPPRLHGEREGEVVQTLSQLADDAAPVARYVSAGENAWIVDLVRAHGSDTAAMARDRHRNVWQKTPGEIRRAIRKAGGTDALLAE